MRDFLLQAEVAALRCPPDGGMPTSLVIAVGGTTILTLASGTTGMFRVPAGRKYTYTYTSARADVFILG